MSAPGSRGGEAAEVTDRRALRRSLRTDFRPSVKLRAIRAAFRVRQATHVLSLISGARLDRPIFIVGAPRSGTSLLYGALRASVELAHWPGEAHEVWEADYHPALRGWESNELDASDVTPEAARRIRRSFLLTAGRGKRLIDKTPRNSLRIGFVDALFPDARYIFLYRDGRDNVNSLINAWRTPRYRTYALPEPHAIPGVDARWWKFVLYRGWQRDRHGPLQLVCARQWIECNERALDALRAIDSRRWTPVAYESLVDDPVAEVRRLMEFLDLPFEDAVRARAEAVRTTPVNVVTPPEKGKWRRENPEEISAIIPLVAPTMGALGYRTD